VSSRRACLIALCGLAMVVAQVRPAAAAEDRAARAARAHFQRAEKAFSMGKFDDALKGYEAAYEAKALPGLLFNIAQCHRNLANPERAIFFYQRYLALDPATPNRALVDQLIGEEQKKIDERTPVPAAVPRLAPAAPPAPAPATLQVSRSERDAEAPPLYKRWWAWAGAAAVVAGVAAALLITREGPPPRGGLGAVDLR
jgi:tetratricopeptide (TPR) repeat protein